METVIYINQETGEEIEVYEHSTGIEYFTSRPLEWKLKEVAKKK